MEIAQLLYHHVMLQVVSHTSTEINCLTGEPPQDSPAVADEDGSYSIAENGYRFRGE